MMPAEPLLYRVKTAVAEGTDLETLAEFIISESAKGVGPIPIQNVCAKFGLDCQIGDLKDMAGILLSDPRLTRPLVIVRSSDSSRRRRFTTAHELAHFLLGHLGAQTTPGVMEEANADRLAALLLAPPSRVRSFLKGTNPDIEDVQRLANAFDISIEAAAHAYVEFHQEPIAVLITRKGRIERCYRNRKRFPFVIVSIGDPIPINSIAHRMNGSSDQNFQCIDLSLSSWTRPNRGDDKVVVEYAKKWSSGSLLILLHLRSMEGIA